LEDRARYRRARRVRVVRRGQHPGVGVTDVDVAAEAEALDAYSRVVMTVAQRLLPSVASLKVMARVPGGRRPSGAGSGVVVTPDGFLLTSAHVVAKASGGVAAFGDGRELEFEVVGGDALSDLAVIRVRVPADGASL